MTPDLKQIQKLPKWAQEYIADLVRERDSAQSMLKRMADDQTPSPIYIDDWYSVPSVKRFVQSPANRVTIEHAGVHCEIYLASEKDGQRLHGIEINYSDTDHRLHCEVAVIPRGIGNIQLVSKENLR